METEEPEHLIEGLLSLVLDLDLDQGLMICEVTVDLVKKGTEGE